MRRRWSIGDERRRAVVAGLEPMLSKHRDMRERWVDVEAFTADCSDELIAQTSDPRAWNHLFEALRDSALFTTPYSVGMDPDRCRGQLPRDYENTAA